MPRDSTEKQSPILDREAPTDQQTRVAVQAGGDDAATQQPSAIWAQGVEEGARRLDRRPLGEAATGLIGGVDVMLGVAATSVVAGALASTMPVDAAATLGALVFGIGFVFITIGRSELFSENFLIPVGAVFEGRRPVSLLARTWAITLATNILGLFLMGVIFSTGTVLHHSAIEAAGRTADVFAARSPGAAFLSAVAAGIVMTLWTWLSTAARTDIGRIAIALVVGFTIAAPTMNHVIVGTGEMMFGVLGGATHATWGDVWANFGLALAGNLVGGMGFVTLTRFVQARGEDGGAARR